MKIIFLRHGQTHGNKEGRYIGSTDERLSDEGRRKLENLICPLFEGIHFVYLSPRVRCIETAEILFSRIEKKIVNDLAECNFGTFEYKNYEELSGNETYQQWIDSGGRIAFPGGESREEFLNRCVKAFYEVIKDAMEQQYEFITLVIHGGTIMSILDVFSEPHRDFYDWQVKNGCGFIAVLNEEMWLQGIHRLYDIKEIEYKFVLKE